MYRTKTRSMHKLIFPSQGRRHSRYKIPDVVWRDIHILMSQPTFRGHCKKCVETNEVFDSNQNIMRIIRETIVSGLIKLVSQYSRIWHCVVWLTVNSLREISSRWYRQQIMWQHLNQSTKLKSHATPVHMGFPVNTVMPEQVSLQVVHIFPVTVVL